MRWRVFMILSVAANLVLALGWLLTLRWTPRPAPGLLVGGTTNPPVEVRTNIVFRRQFFLWSELESPDYATYITNLRSIACPEQTIRDIIIADVNALFAKRRATEVLTPEQQWWRTAPDVEVQAAASTKLRQLDDERRGLLASLLGPQWETGDQVSLPRPTRPGVQLDGPVLGALPNEVKQALQEINSYSQDRLKAYVEARQRDGKPLEPVELAKLRQQTRQELARVLTPLQLEEFLLRFSLNATMLRTELGQLQFFNASQDEFRALFRARDAYDQQLVLLGDAGDPALAQQRAALEQQREAATKLALGEKRYAEYQRLHDEAFRTALGEAQQAGVPEAADTLREIRQAVADEQQRIRNDSSLTDEQKNIELKRIELEQLKATTLALGQELPPEPPLPPTPTRSHSFQAHDNLITLALQYDVSVNSIIAANPDVNFNRLRLGDTIRIPTPAKK
jgi:hypothetical protein